MNLEEVGVGRGPFSPEDFARNVALDIRARHHKNANLADSGLIHRGLEEAMPLKSATE